MELTFITDLGQTFVVEIDPNMELENVMALLEAESGIPQNEQSISHNGRELSNPKATMVQLGVAGSNAMLSLRRRVANFGARAIDQDAEMMRLQLLGDPVLMSQLQQNQPELAAAIQSDPVRFAELLRQTQGRHNQVDQEIQRLKEADPYDVEAQKRIEEAIRQQAVLENLAHAIEYSPEAFGRVPMLYIPVEVNGHPIKAFVDSGAQTTIMSPEAAEACGLIRLLDKRFSGIARGVGTAKILGRVHSAQLKLSDLFLPCSFTIMEGRDVDLLLGLDMLKGHRACIDLEKNVLRIQGREVSFLPEHELPEKARDLKDFTVEEIESAEHSTPSTSSNTGSSSLRFGTTSFPGSGNTLGFAPTSSIGSENQRGSQTRHPNEKIQTLIALGASREEAIRILDVAGGNVHIAASLLF